MKRAILVLFGILGMTAGAQAGIVDTPLPILGGLQVGKSGFYSVAGVMNNGGLATAFSCTNASPTAATIRIGVEVFGANGSPLNSADTTSVSLGAGASATFVTSAAFLAYDVNLALPGSQGSARIVSTGLGKYLLCTSYILDKASNPPTSMTTLTVVLGVKAK